MTDGTGDARFDFVSASSMSPGQFITATATDPSGNTSEFSTTCVAAVADAPGTVGDSLRASHDTTTVVTMMSWQAVPTAVRYDSYRGTIPAGQLGSRTPVAYDHTCFENDNDSGDGPTQIADAADPPPGTGSYYLVGTENDCLQGDLGQAEAVRPAPTTVPARSSPECHRHLAAKSEPALCADGHLRCDPPRLGGIRLRVI